MLKTRQIMLKVTAPLRSTPRIAVVDSEALAGDQRMPKSPQTSNEASDRKIAPLRLSHLPV